jgi:hypothetical protein
MTKRDKDELVVYWSPFYEMRPEEKFDWNHIYAEPTPAFQHLRKNRAANEDTPQSAFHCPSFKQILNNTWVFENTVESKFIYNQKTSLFEGTSEFGLNRCRTMPTYIEGRKILLVPLAWIFFAEESVHLEVTPPYAHDTVHSKYGSLIPGTFDISQWFRPLHSEIIMNTDEDRFHLPEEPFMYVRFNTTKKVILKRFELTPELQKISESIADTKNVFGRFKPLAHRYETFRRARTRDIILPKIKAALLDK